MGSLSWSGKERVVEEGVAPAQGMQQVYHKSLHLLKERKVHDKWGWVIHPDIHIFLENARDPISRG